MTIIQPPFAEKFLAEFQKTTKTIFGDEAETEWLDSLKWRLENMPDVTVVTINDADGIIAFKAGYSTAHNRYYSWLGGVNPKHRRQGIARKLMEQQHDWISRQSRFSLVETHVEQDNIAMIQLNQQLGMEFSGFYMKDAKPYLIMQKSLK